MGSQRIAAQAASELRTKNTGTASLYDFPLLRMKHDLKVRFGTPPGILAEEFGIRNNLPAATENQIELASPVDRVSYALFEVQGELDVFYLSRKLQGTGWHSATTRILVHFGRYIPARSLQFDVAAIGSRYVDDGEMKYPRLEHIDDGWRLVARPYNYDRVVEPMLFLAWR